VYRQFFALLVLLVVKLATVFRILELARSVCLDFSCRMAPAPRVPLAVIHAVTRQIVMLVAASPDSTGQLADRAQHVRLAVTCVKPLVLTAIKTAAAMATTKSDQPALNAAQAVTSAHPQTPALSALQDTPSAQAHALPALHHALRAAHPLQCALPVSQVVDRTTCLHR
jgi:hypothetical protein